MTQQRTSPRARSTHSSRSNSREPRPRHFRPYPESNTRGAPRDERSRKRPAPIDEADGDGDVGMQSDPEQDGDDESSGSSPAPVKQEQESDVDQSPSPPPTPAAGRSARHPPAHPQPAAQTQFAPTPPASAHRLSPPHIAIPTLPQHQRDAHLTLPPMLHPPPEPQQTYQTYQQGHSEPLARKRRRVTISGVAAGSQAAPRPLHRTVLERANNGYQSHNPPSASTATPATPTAMSGMVSPVVTPGFNMNLPGALAQVRDTIAIRMEQKALIEQRKNGGAATVTVTTPHARTAPQPPLLARTQSSPAAQSSALPPPTSNSPLQNTITPPTLPTSTTPTALTGPPPQTQTLAHRRGKASSKLTIHTPNSSISSTQGVPANATGGLGLTGTGSNAPQGPPGPASRLAIPNIEVAIRSAPPNVTRFNPAQIQRPHPVQPPPPAPLRTAQPPPKERSVPIRRMHAGSIAAPGGPLAVVAAGHPLVLNAAAPPSSYVPTPTRTQFPPHTPHPQPPRTARPPTSPPISRNAFMAFYDAYAEVHVLRAQVERMEREMARRVEAAVHEMKEEIRMLREEVRRGHERDVGHPREAAYPPYPRDREPGYARERAPDYAREREIYSRERTDSTFTRERVDSTFARDRVDSTFARERGDSTFARDRGDSYARDWDRRRGGSTSVNQSPMQLDKRPLPGHSDKMQLDKPIERPALPGPGDRLPPPPGERIPGPGERLGPGDRIVGPGERIPPPPPVPGASSDKLHKPVPRSALRKSPSGRNLPSSLSPPSRAPSIGAAGGTPGASGNGAGPGGETGAQTRAHQRVRTKSPGGDKSGSG
ncbi:unnamed protein product [Rhizoctonia solani]|uniref:Uncharacterized protein n=1 Tax=Rhizoctonia solani TaxID=456999 RepID=A0A8H2WWR3_9AGAM|nr:unnamed protein product [Rhizoctonia solani]